MVVTGAASALGRRVTELAAADPAVEAVIALDQRALQPPIDGVRAQVVDLAAVDLKPLFEGATSVVHLAQAPGPEMLAGHGLGDGALARRVLEAASAVGTEHVVLLSSALVYGAWANNPVPITEDAPLRPNPGVTVASEKAELERTAAEWRDAHPAATVALLRPTVTVSADGNGWLARALARSGAVPVADDEPPAQFLDVDDLATAVDLARSARLDGPRNVAPDGWISGDTVRSLAGGAPRVRLPERVALRLAALGWRWRPRPHAARAAALHGAPLGDRQRSPQGGGLAAGQLQRGGLRRRPPRRPVGDRQPAPSPGAGAGCGGPGRARRRRPRRSSAPRSAAAEPLPERATTQDRGRW